MTTNDHHGPQKVEKTQSASTNERSVLRVLVAIASYGAGNDAYLKRLVEEYQSMPFNMDIVILSNIEKNLGANIETRVGLPSKNPWSLPFGHKSLFCDRAGSYDLFIYSEDDILITERNIRAFISVTRQLHDDEIAGFVRVEMAEGKLSYPDAHAHFHWDPTSVRKRGAFTLARFTNEHAACYLLTQAQLLKAIKSGGFAVGPHEEKYDLLCTAATDPYTQCGFTKLIPISHLDDYTVHHMSNKYAFKVGVDETEFRGQIEALLDIEKAGKPPRRLIEGETRLPGAIYSKDHHEPATPEVMALIPRSARSVLSVGCGGGATEIALAESGLSVTAVPLDAVTSRGAAEAGVEMIEADFQSARQRLEGRSFDAVLMLNVLHLTPDPVGALGCFGALLSPGAPIIIQSPNMSNLPSIWRQIRDRRLEIPFSFQKSGAHFSSTGVVQKWCRKAGLAVEQTTGVLHPRVQAYDGMVPAVARLRLASEIVAVARRALPQTDASASRSPT